MKSGPGDTPKTNGFFDKRHNRRFDCNPLSTRLNQKGVRESVMDAGSKSDADSSVLKKRLGHPHSEK